MLRVNFSIMTARFGGVNCQWRLRCWDFHPIYRARVIWRIALILSMKFSRIEDIPGAFALSSRGGHSRVGAQTARGNLLLWDYKILCRSTCPSTFPSSCPSVLESSTLMNSPLILRLRAAGSPTKARFMMLPVFYKIIPEATTYYSNTLGRMLRRSWKTRLNMNTRKALTTYWTNMYSEGLEAQKISFEMVRESFLPIWVHVLKAG